MGFCAFDLNFDDECVEDPLLFYILAKQELITLLFRDRVWNFIPSGYTGRAGHDAARDYFTLIHYEFNG